MVHIIKSLINKSLVNNFGYFNTNKFSGSDKEWVSNCVENGVVLQYEDKLSHSFSRV